jgi:hypothetical protein
MYSLISAPFFRADISVCRLSGARYNFRFRRAIYSLAVLLCLPVTPATAAGINFTSYYSDVDADTFVGGERVHSAEHSTEVQFTHEAFAINDRAVEYGDTGVYQLGYAAATSTVTTNGFSFGSDSLSWSQELLVDASARSTTPYCPPPGGGCLGGLPSIASAGAGSGISFVLDQAVYFELTLTRLDLLTPWSSSAQFHLSGPGGETIYLTGDQIVTRSGYLGAGIWTIAAFALADSGLVQASPPQNGGGNNQALSNGSVRFHTTFNITTVPVPAAAWLFVGALGLLGVVRRRSAA